MRHFPYDVQECKLQIGSATNDGSVVTYQFYHAVVIFVVVVAVVIALAGFVKGFFFLE